MATVGDPTNPMSFLLPPSRSSLAENARRLAAEWKSAGALVRYFIASQLLSGVLVGACALAAVPAAVAGLSSLYGGLLGAACACLVHTVVTWNVLKRRFAVRYEVW